LRLACSGRTAGSASSSLAKLDRIKQADRNGGACASFYDFLFFESKAMNIAAPFKYDISAVGILQLTAQLDATNQALRHGLNDFPSSHSHRYAAALLLLCANNLVSSLKGLSDRLKHLPPGRLTKVSVALLDKATRDLHEQAEFILKAGTFWQSDKNLKKVEFAMQTFRRIWPTPRVVVTKSPTEEDCFAWAIADLGLDMGAFVLGRWSSISAYQHLPGVQEVFYNLDKAAPGTKMRGQKYAATALLPVLRDMQEALRAHQL
jgi:hypothetical protein